MPATSTPRPTSDLLLKLAKQLYEGSESKRRMKKNAVTNMNGAALTREMKKYAIPDKSMGETGIMRIQVLHALGLGLPPSKYWTKKSIIYVLDHILNVDDYDKEKVKNKDSAIRFLQEVIAENGSNETQEKSQSSTITDLTTLIPTYCVLASKLREIGAENDAKICDHADKYGEGIEPETFERLTSMVAADWGDKSSGNEATTSKRLFTGDTSPTPAKLQKRRKALMEQVSSVEKLLRQEVEESQQRLRARRRSVSYAEVEDDEESTNNTPSVNAPTEDVERIYPTTTALDPRDLQPQRRNSTGSFGIVWSNDDTHTNMVDNAKLFLQQPLHLSRDEGGWEQIVNFANTREVIYQDHRQIKLRGMHFFTACAMLVAQCPNVEDNTGFGEAPTLEGNEEIAREWLGRIYQEGVKRLGNGCIFNQIKFSHAARKGLAGAGNNPPDPSHVATFFSQLYNATNGNEKKRKQPSQTTMSSTESSARMTIPPPHAIVPPDILQSITSQAKTLAPAGLDLTILERAVKGIASKKGATFRDKQMGGLKALSNGSRSKESERESYQELDWATAMSSKQATSAAISLSIEALESARITRSNAGLMNLGHDNVKKCILAVITRRFTSTDFQLHLLIPRTSGAPDVKDIKNALGEAQNTKRTASITNVTSESEDRRYYMYLRLAIEAMIVIIAPTLDFGLTNALRFYSENTPIFEVSGTPLCMVTRALCKTLTSAMRQRDQALINTNNDTEQPLCYIEPLDVNQIKQKLISWSRDDQEDEYIKYKRFLDTYQSPNGTQHTESVKKRESTTNSRTLRSDKQEAKSERKTVSMPSIPIATWTEKYGTKIVNGSKVKLCWYHCNRQGGCGRQDTCPNDHSHYPDKYNGKCYKDLTDGQRNDIQKACKRP